MNKASFMLLWWLVCLVSFLMVIGPDENTRAVFINLFQTRTTFGPV